MPWSYRRAKHAAERFAGRRRREDQAPRLCREVPGLSSLRLEFEEQCDVGVIRHARRIVVDRAPAIFLVLCCNPRCEDGEHDLTATVMRALHAGETSFDGEDDDCTGSVGASACPRALRFHGAAEYHA